jgi:hypothetical protein
MAAPHSKTERIIGTCRRKDKNEGGRRDSLWQNEPGARVEVIRMGLNIKNEEAPRLARELAALTGESVPAEKPARHGKPRRD